MIKINDLELQEVSYTQQDSTLCLQFEIENMSLQELEEYFSLNNNTIIEQYENDILINKWYYKNFQSIGYEKTENGWHIKLSLEVTHFSQSDIDEIYDLIGEKNEELTELTSQINVLNNSMTTVLNNIEEQRNEMNETTISFQNMISNFENQLAHLFDRVARLENTRPQTGS